MLSLSRLVSEECDEKLLSESSSNKVGGDYALTELLKRIQKQLNSMQGQVKDMKLDNKTSRPSLPNDGEDFFNTLFIFFVILLRTCLTKFESINLKFYFTTLLYAIAVNMLFLELSSKKGFSFNYIFDAG